jgi:hypothetical protein
LPDRRSGNRQTVFLRQAQQQGRIQRIIHAVTHQAGDVQPAQQIVIQHLIQCLWVDGGLSALRRAWRANFVTAGHLFLLHIDRYAEIGATFSLSVQEGQTAPQFVLQREIIFHFYRSGKQRFDDSQLIDATIAAVLEAPCAS